MHRLLDHILNHNAEVSETTGCLVCPECGGDLIIDWFEKAVTCPCDNFGE